MSQTRDLFRRTTSIFTAHPILWLPLVAADVLRSIVLLVARPLTRAALMASAPRSVLGGGISGMPSPAKLFLIGNGIGFAATVLGLLFYVYALGVVARAVDPDAQKASRTPVLEFGKPEGIWPAWLRVCGLAALFTLFTTVFLSMVVIPWSLRAGVKPTILQWLLPAVILLVTALVLYPSVGMLRSYVLQVQSQPPERQGEPMPYFLVLAAAVVCGTLASGAIAYLTRRSVATPAIANTAVFMALQVLVSAVTAFPYAYAMTGLSLSQPADPEFETNGD